MDKILLVSIIVVISGISYLVINQLSSELPKLDYDPLSIFTVCHPVDDPEKSQMRLEGYITWTKDYCLNWKDFQNSTISKDSHAAYTTWYVKTFSDIDIVKSTTPQFKFTHIETVAFFDKKKSWVFENVTRTSDITLLRHEQGHFDYAEEHARLVENMTRTRLLGKTFPILVKSENVNSDARNEADILTKKIFDELDNLQTLQDEYDRYTGNGTKFREQQEYNLRFDKLRSP